MSISKVTGRVIESNTIPEVETLEANTTQLQSDVTQINSSMGFKNRIIGGNFSTNPWQRGTGFTGVTSAYTADRFLFYEFADAVTDGLKTADAPTVAEAGVFTQHCFHVDVTTADSSIGASQWCQLRHIIEGYNLLDLGFGQSGTRYFTLSFWHKHTKTGTYNVSFANDGFSRAYVSEYTQSVSDTWEKAELTIPVDTSGTWNYTNGVGLYIRWVLAAGSDFNVATAGQWLSGLPWATSNQVNALDSTLNNFKIALVQLEAGQTATRFETRSVGQELELCQRYYQTYGTENGVKSGGYSTQFGLFDQNTIPAGNCFANVTPQTTMRALPSFTALGAFNGSGVDLNNTNWGPFTTSFSDNTRHIAIQKNTDTMTTNQTCIKLSFTLSAELL